MSPPRNKYKVFVSHSNRDQISHSTYLPRFERRALETTIDVSFPRGENWYYSILIGLLRSDAIVGILTENALDSDWVVQELGFGASMDYVYLVGEASIIDVLKSRAASDADRDSILPICKTLLSFEVDVVADGKTFEEHLAKKSTIKSIRKFSKSRASHQREYRGRLADLLENEEAIDESTINSTTLQSMLSLRHQARGSIEGIDASAELQHQRVLASLIRTLIGHFGQLKMARAPSALADYEKAEILASVQRNTEQSKSYLAAGPANDNGSVPIELCHSMDLFLVHAALAIAERQVLVHLLIRDGRLDLAFNAMGYNSQAIHVYCEASVRVIDDLSSRGMG